MKRTITLLLAVLLVLTMVCCSCSNSDHSDKPADTTEQHGENTNTPAETDKPADPVRTEPAPTEPPAVFEEVTVVDNDYCTIKVTEIDPNNIWGYTLKVFFENKSSDKTYMFSVTDASVNGVEWDPLFAAEIPAGKKKNDEISFSDDEKTALLSEFTDIELTFRVHDSDDWSADDVANETVHIYPLGEDKATAYVRDPQPTDKVIVDNDQITIIVTGYATDTFWGYSAKMYLVNKTDKKLMFSSDDVSVNGYMCDPYWAISLAPGKVAFTSMSWSESTFEENGITEVEEIVFALRVYEYDNWSEEDIFNETVTLNP
ncbi:MAG: hypothetical protein K6G56_00785 [Clostridiales bacterium]|nr:hypothetical protein [Clostridiales bacterium]